MTDLYTRLDQVGFPRSYVKERILPDWWEDNLAADPGNRRLAEMAISRTLKIPLRDLIAPAASLSLEGAREQGDCCPATVGCTEPSIGPWSKPPSTRSKAE